MAEGRPTERSTVEHSQHDQLKAEQKAEKEVVRETIDQCARALTRTGAKYYLFVADKCENVLAPVLLDEHGHEVNYYDKQVGQRDEFYCGPLFRAAEGRLVDHEERKLMEEADLARLSYVGINPVLSPARRDIEKAFESLVVIAEYEGYVQSEMRDMAEVRGHELPLGIIREPWERDSPEEIQIVDPAAHPPVSVNQGLPGFGKTTAGTTEVEDRYAAGKKVIDVADLNELENGLYDIPQGQDDLRDIREEMELPADFLEADEYPRPSIEVLAPLTPGLEAADVPFQTDTDETVVRPFTIPAADIPRKALNMMLSHLTDVQQNYLDRAYQNVSEQDDWSLRDLAEAVLKTDAQEGVKRRLYNTLGTLQSLGFIRTRTCEYALDWEEIFRDAGTITVFTQSLVEDGAHKFMVLSYLIHSLYHERQEYYNLPPLAAVFRELHHVAPNDRTARQDEREREVQRGMVAAFQELCSMHRHEDIEVLADTQQLMGQISKRAREHVERVVTFRAQMGTLKPLFKDMVGLDGDRFDYLTTIARDFEVGQAAVIGYTGTNRSLEMPIEFAPPMSHHLDATSPYGDGWIARTKILTDHDDLPDEELRPAPWDATVPEELDLAPRSLSEDEPVATFADRCLDETDGSKIGVGELYEAMQAFADHNDLDGVPPKNHFGRMLGEQLDFERKKVQRSGNREMVYHGLRFTAQGERFRPD